MALDCAADKSLARTHPFYLRICSASSAPRPAGVQRDAKMALDCAADKSLARPQPPELAHGRSSGVPEGLVYVATYLGD